jgi:hypothetical protein
MARILAPRTGDTVTIPVGGTVSVTAWYSYAVSSTLQCSVDTDHDAGPMFTGTNIDPGKVVCTKAANTYTNVPVTILTNGTLPYDDTQAITLKVVAPQIEAVVNRVNPLPPAALPAPGTGPIQYIVSDNFAAGVAYVVCVAQELDLNTAIAPLPVDGVWIRNNNPTWAGLLTIPNNVGKMYTARIIEFDANDVILNYSTVILSS